MHIQIVLLVLAVIVNLSLGFVVLNRIYKTVYGWLFAAIVFCSALWGIGDAMMLAIHNSDLIRLAEGLFYAVPIFIPMFVILFGLSFASQGKHLSKRIVGLICTLPIILALIILIKPSSVSGHIALYPNRLNMVWPNLHGFFFLSVYYTLYFFITYTVLYRKMQEAKGVKKTQLAYTLYGVLISSIAALVANLLLPQFNVVNLIWLGPIFSLFFVLSVTVAMVKHRLFDIRLAIVRSVTYVGSLAVLALGFNYIVLTILKDVFKVRINSSSELFISVAAALIALVFPVLKSFFDKLTNRLFYQDSYDPQQLFDNLNRILISTLNLDTLLKQSSTLIADTLKANYCAIGLGVEGDKVKIVGNAKIHYSTDEINIVRRYLAHTPSTKLITDDLEDNDELKHLFLKKNVAALIPLSQHSRKKDREMGYIVIGVKKSGNTYSSQDYRVLETIAKELILAIQNALRFEQIQNFNLTLQQKIDDATRNLRRNNEKLKAIDETKDDFISMASHQLRTPLTSIKGYLSMLKEGDAGKLTKVQKDMIEQAYISSQRMVYLISDMLNVSRLKTGKFAVELTRFNLADLVYEEVDQLVDTANSKGLSLTYEKPDEFPDYMLDETKIRQVIMNYIDNAIYYTPGGGHIEVKLENLPGRIELKVVDDGIGVPSSEKHHLFNKFFRANNARKARPDGTGLGLYMAKKVIVAQGGAVVFDSKEGKGSTFGFIFHKSKIKIPEEFS